ncbi:NAD-dependent succinate-semialdehyde dehydrogenase [Pelagibacterium lacus]|uniref:NAD-dependent succinate-semialdehyde dehydrogenase n=1 Tax=Pelagibacterium lacus TaxID=2282655 RepID=A0A369W9E5_9HYPH|nr:NAD-dependent succinate-semialdehyde dehydrogenase [Pelagibacterium lacus]RDE08701.1 NAD-dependent succinate-semialdehyde dehydrogenase [Pelagibacterium lacus]
MTKLLRQNVNLIDGNWAPAASGETIDVINPADGSIVGRVPKSGTDETRQAIEAAAKAFETFRHTSAQERADMLMALYDAIRANVDELAHILTSEQGKPISEARGEIGLSAAYIRWFAEEARRVYGDIVPSPFKHRKLLVNKEPIGVCAAITPWNFPSSMLSRKVGPAIAAGCAVVIKPASQTPFSGLAWGVLAEKAGIPEGVVNVVTGSAREIGRELTANPKVRKITFTGSTEVGKTLMAQSAMTVKKVSMELGGNAPFIVFADADIDKAVEAAVVAKYRNSGQTCVCTNRFFVEDGIYDQLVDKLAQRTRALKVGPGIEAGVELGPLIDLDAVEKIESLIADALDRGASLVAGGGRHASGGTFFEPTVLSGVTTEMKISREEIFGPVSAVHRFSGEDKVVRMANDTPYGLAAYFFTRDLGRAFRVADALNFGMVGVNEGFITTEVAPFGGVKESGVGSEGGRQGIEEYLVTKYVSLGGLG